MALLLTIVMFYPLEDILYMDETGFYQRQTYGRSWSPVGEPCYDKVDASKGKRLNLIGAMSLSEFKIMAPRTFTGNCNRNLVEDWIHQLGDTLNKDKWGKYPKRFLIMDNARFHKGGNLKAIARLYNITIMYLPPYSPDLNPIELLWAVIKQKVRLAIRSFDDLQSCLDFCTT